MVVFDASTLILLAKIELLRDIAGSIDIIITTQVEMEATYKKGLFDAQLIKSFIENQEIKVETVSWIVGIENLKKDFNIESGEASSLVLAKQKGAILATDDGPAIKAAKILGIKFVTAIDFLVRFYEKGILTKEITMIKLEKLKEWGRYDPQIINDVRKRLEKGGKDGCRKHQVNS